jgi:hypothetical protein
LRGLLAEHARLAQFEEALHGGAIGVGQSLDVLRRGIFVEQGLEDLLGQQARDSGMDGGVFGQAQVSQMDHRGVAADSAGVTIEGVKADTGFGELEFLEDAFVSRRRAIDNGAIKPEAKVWRDLVEDGGIGLEVVQMGR